MLTMATAIILACGGGGTAIKPDSTTISGEQSGSYDYGRGSYDGSFEGTISGTRQQGYVDQVDIEINGNAGRIRLPRVVLPLVRGGENGWFEIKNLRLSDRTIEGNAAVNFMNKPKIYIDRMTGSISINGKSGTYTGRCQKVEAAAQPQF